MGSGIFKSASSILANSFNINTLVYMNKKATINYVSPCGMYCIACPKYEDRSACRVCRVDSRHNNCDIYDCCVTMGGMDFCFECDCFPCERLKEFVNFNSGKSFAHFRHVAIENLNRIKAFFCFLLI